jgi:uncharacterized protein (TIGR02996 family)
MSASANPNSPKRPPRLVPEPFVVEAYFRRFPRCEGLLRDIAAEPWEDRLRLILADWLEDHGEAKRAEHIRLECELDRTADRNRWARLYARVKQLFEEDGDLIGDAGARALAKSPHLSGLHSLELTSNRIGAAGQQALRRCWGLVRL